MCLPSRLSWIVYNGEVYNFLEIREQLRSLGYQFTSGTDTEVVLQAYQEWGEQCLEHFNGMWAFAIWDAMKGELFAARDRFGIKPFYYTYDEHHLIFASEIKAILSTELVERRPNDPALFDFCVHGITDHSQETFFKGILRLPAGHWLRLDVKRWQLRLCPYYQLPLQLASNRRVSETEAAECVRALLQDAVRIQSISDVPIGTCLSGGLDSTSVACLLHGLIPSRTLRCQDYQRTFSLIYGHPTYDESSYIDEVVSSIQSNHAYTTLTPRTVLNDLINFIWHQEEPFDKIGVYSQWHLYKLVHASGVKVTLDGQGGDELFAGYDGYFPEYYSLLLRERRLGDWMVELVGFLVHHGIAKASTFVPSPRQMLSRAVKRPFPIDHRPPNYSPRPPNWLSRDFHGSGCRHCLTPDPPGSERLNGLSRRLYRSLMLESLPPALRLSDKNAMAQSVESRYPFLDHRLVELAFSLPDRFKIRFGQTKYVLRQAMAGVLPIRVRRRQDKMGFWLVLPEWFREERLRGFVFDICDSTSFRRRPYFNARNCRDGFAAFLRGNSYQHFWRWLNVELWLREYIDGGSPSFPSSGPNA